MEDKWVCNVMTDEKAWIYWALKNDPGSEDNVDISFWLCVCRFFDSLPAEWGANKLAGPISSLMSLP